MKRTLLALSAFTFICAAISAQDSPLWLRKNAISPDGEQVAFAYKGNIYVVESDGGQARQITSNPAYDTDPLWSPDGESIIFASYRNKSKDIYRIPATGGAPVRLTSHPGNETPMTVLEDGSVIFSASIQQDARYGDFPGGSQIYMIGKDGGRPELVTSLQMSDISVAPDGTVIYEDYKGYEDPLRKHHTSSVTRDIWMYIPSTMEKFSIDGAGIFLKCTTFKGEDRNPVFVSDGSAFYYLSEQDGTLNIYYSGVIGNELKDGNIQPKQITFHKGNPVRYLSISRNGTLCYSYDGELYTIREGGQPEKIDIQIVTDQIEKETELQTFTSGATRMAVSPEGKEIAITVRGDVFVTSIDYKTTQRITNTPEQERGLTFSKDGRTLYYAAERNGHWGIWKTSLTEKDDKMFTYAVKMKEEMVTAPGETCFQPQVSPDGKLLAYLKDRTAIAVMDLKSGKEKIVLDRMVNYSYTDGDQ